jgi:uncharacterized SAM-binding protein YcdF (DUF218 family)
MELRYLLKSILLPPFAQILILIFAWRLRNLRPRIAKAFYLLAILSLWILGTPIAAKNLAFTLKQDLPIRPNYLSNVNADAIVILSGSQNETATEFGEPVSGEDTLIRIRYGAFLKRRTGLPVLLSGGSVLNDKDRSLAETMAFDLIEGFGLQTEWLETKSRTTAENAKFSYTILKAENKTSILLVTSSLHMMRAKWSFEQAGFNVLPAPTGFIAPEPLTVSSFLPNAHSLQLSSDVLHEWFGYWVYRILN